MKMILFKKKSKLFWVLLIIFLLILSITTQGRLFWDNVSDIIGASSRDSIADDYDLSIHILDVGNADCILIECGEYSVIVDGGTPNYSDYILAYLNKRGIDEIDAVFISHSDYDHYSGLISTAEEIPVLNLYTNSIENTSESYQNVYSAIISNGAEHTVLSSGDEIIIGDMIFTLLSPSTMYEDSNNNSLVFKLTYNDFTMLFMGDAEIDVIEDLIELDVDLSADVLKVSHHGSSDATSKEFINLVNPKLAVISVGTNSYNLPGESTLQILEENNIEYYLTNQHGTIILSTNADGFINISTKNDN